MGDVPESGLGQYASVLRGRWLLILVTTVLGGLVAAGYLLVVPTSYSATAAVQISVIASDPFQSSQSASDLIDGRTEASIATSFAVASMAAEQFEAHRTPNEIREFTEATPVADATVLEISYTSRAPQNARNGADAIAAAYLHYREAQARDRLSSMIDMIDDQLTGLRQELVQANAMSAAADANSSEANQAASDRELVTIEINSLITRKNVLESINTAGGVVLTPAKENPLELAPNKRLVAASGVLGGLLLGVVLAFVVKGLDRRVSTRFEIARVSGSRVLAELPEAHGAIPARAGDLAGLRLAREQILADLPTGMRTVLVLNQAPASVRTVDLAANFALVFAQEQRAVDLVLPAPDEPTAEFVLSTLELDSTSIDPKLQVYDSRLVPNLTVAMSARGTTITEPDPIITRAIRQRLNEKHLAGFRFLVLDAGVAAPSRLAAHRHCDAAVLVVARGATHADRITASADELKVAGVPLLGVVTVPRGRDLPLEQVSAAVAEKSAPTERAEP